MSSVVRLIISILGNIIFLSRTDYSLSVKPLESFGKIIQNIIKILILL